MATKKKSKQHAAAGAKKKRCGNCRKSGHNARTCPG
jgi:hypothetical protein